MQLGRPPPASPSPCPTHPRGQRTPHQTQKQRDGAVRLQQVPEFHFPNYYYFFFKATQLWRTRAKVGARRSQAEQLTPATKKKEPRQRAATLMASKKSSSPVFLLVSTGERQARAGISKELKGVRCLNPI